jgi:hypothetical protein
MIDESVGGNVEERDVGGVAVLDLGETVALGVAEEVTELDLGAVVALRVAAEMLVLDLDKTPAAGFAIPSTRLAVAHQVPLQLAVTYPD